MPLANLPSFCRVSIVVQSAINIEVWLPVETWNNRFKGVGGGGYAGVISWSALAGALRDGYATASTDTGHTSAEIFDASFAFNPDGTLNWQLIEDFASRSVIEMTEKAKAVIRAFYGSRPRYSYWMGCSTGGRQGLIQVQRTPHAYDGVLASSPAINWDRSVAAQLWPQIAMQQEAGGPIDACKFELVNNAALAACDGIDGVVDGLLDDPRRCDFDPVALQCSGGVTPDCNCLTSGEVSAISKIWDGARSTTGKRLWFGLERMASHVIVAGTNPFQSATQRLQWTKMDPEFDWRVLGYEGFEQYFEEAQALFNDVIGTDDPNLEPFRESRGKVIIWHGWTDQFLSARGSIDYYRRVVDQIGSLKQTKKFARLFLAPGVNHCEGGVGPNAFGQQADNRMSTAPLINNDPRYDIFAALVRWVERDRAPNRIIATKYVNDDPAQGVERTRPLCVYPKTAVYDGGGSIDDAGSFDCRKPDGDNEVDDSDVGDNHGEQELD
jgi:hypothetical protein